MKASQTSRGPRQVLPFMITTDVPALIKATDRTYTYERFRA